MALDVEFQPLEQQRKAAIEVVAVSAGTGAVRQSLCRFEQVDAPPLAERDPDRLVRNPLDVGTVQPEQRVERRRRHVTEAEPGEIRVEYRFINGDAVLHRHFVNASFNANGTRHGW